MRNLIKRLNTNYLLVKFNTTYIMLSLNIISDSTQKSQTKPSCNCKDLGFRPGGPRASLGIAKYSGGNTYICNHYNLKAVFPKIIPEWDNERNKLSPDNYAPSSNKKVWWTCKSNQCGCHVWESRIYIL